MHYKYIAALLLAGSTATLRAQSYQEYVEKGMTLLKQDSLLQAESSFVAAIQKEPTQKSNCLLYNILGQIQERTGRMQEAINSFNNALVLDPSSIEILQNRASVYLALNNEDKALLDYSSIIEKEPENEEALFFRAYILSNKRMYKEARNDYEKIIKQNPRHEKAILGLALVNNKSGRPREAMEQINQLIRFNPTQALYYNIRGGVHVQNKNYEQAIKDYNKAVELEPNNPEHLISRSECFQKMKKKKQLVKYHINIKAKSNK